MNNLTNSENESKHGMRLMFGHSILTAAKTLHTLYLIGEDDALAKECKSFLYVYKGL